MRKNVHNRTLTALVLSVCMAFVLCLPAGAAALDISEPCSIRVKVSDELWTDLQTANVVVDLYQIAAVVPQGDGYTYSVLAPFSSPADGQTSDSAMWQAYAQAAAETALSVGTPVVAGMPIGADMGSSDSGAALGPGMYLLIARGAELEDYSTTALTEDGEDQLVTRARTEDYDYYFAPEIISVPDVPGGELGLMNDTWPLRLDQSVSEWVYDLEVGLKMSREPRFGSVAIEKSLLTYESAEPATFVFDIRAELDGTVVYSNVIAMTFTSAGERRELIDRIPVGAEVTVREIYSGARYRSTAATEGTVVVSAEEIGVVSFENDYAETPTGGHGIINRFTFDGETWRWEQTDGTDALGGP